MAVSLQLNLNEKKKCLTYNHLSKDMLLFVIRLSNFNFNNKFIAQTSYKCSSEFFKQPLTFILQLINQQ